jgi:hypothetical protein
MAPFSGQGAVPGALDYMSFYIIISLIMNFTRKKVVILAAYAITETTDHG